MVYFTIKSGDTIGLPIEIKGKRITIPYEVHRTEIPDTCGLKPVKLIPSFTDIGGLGLEAEVIDVPEGFLELPTVGVYFLPVETEEEYFHDLIEVEVML